VYGGDDLIMDAFDQKIENHEYRLGELEKWQETHDGHTLQSIREMADVLASVRSIAEVKAEQTRQATETRAEISDMRRAIDKIPWYIAGAAVAFIAQMLVVLLKH